MHSIADTTNTLFDPRFLLVPVVIFLIILLICFLLGVLQVLIKESKFFRVFLAVAAGYLVCFLAYVLVSTMTPSKPLKVGSGYTDPIDLQGISFEDLDRLTPAHQQAFLSSLQGVISSEDFDKLSWAQQSWFLSNGGKVINQNQDKD